jgi:hypothetical protein
MYLRYCTLFFDEKQLRQVVVIELDIKKSAGNLE